MNIHQKFRQYHQPLHFVKGRIPHTAIESNRFCIIGILLKFFSRYGTLFPYRNERQVHPVNLMFENLLRIVFSCWKVLSPFIPLLLKLGGFVILYCIGRKLWKKALRPLLRKIQKPERIILLLLAGCMVLVLPLSWWGAYLDPEPGDCWLFEGIHAAFDILGGDSNAFRADAFRVPMIQSVPALPLILSCAVPLLTVAATLGLLWNYLPHHVPWGAKVWYLFSALDVNSVRLAKSLSNDGSLCIFLRTQRGDPDPELLSKLQDINYFLYPQDERRFLLYPWRRNHKMRFFFLSDHSDENFNRMRAFLENVKQAQLFASGRKEDETEFQQELYLLAETESASMLIDYLRDMMYENGQRLPVFARTELRLLDRYRSISYDLLRKQPLHKFVSDETLNVLVLGFGRVGQAFFRAACSQGMIYHCATSFTLCDQQMDSKLHAFLSQCPELKRHVSIQSRQFDADTKKLEKLVQDTDFHYIVVALGDDERDIRVASRLKRFYRTRHWEALSRNESQAATSPQICVHVENAIKQDYTRQLWRTEKDWDHPLIAFGGSEDTFTRDVLMPESLWNAARWIHRQLNGITANSPMQWSEYERRSSIACTAHAEYHVASVCTGDSDEPYEVRLSRYTAEEREALIDTEHRRWMAYVCSEGMCKADVSLMDAYFDEIGGRHVDTLGKLTPCLVNTKDALNAIWEYLETSHSEKYQGKTPFRQRDTFLVTSAGIIARGIETGVFPERAANETECAPAAEG